MITTGEARPIKRSSRRLACKFQGETRAKSPETSGSGNLSRKHDLTPKSKSLGLPRKKHIHREGRVSILLFPANRREFFLGNYYLQSNIPRHVP